MIAIILVVSWSAEKKRHLYFLVKEKNEWGISQSRNYPEGRPTTLSDKPGEGTDELALFICKWA
ncbi:hypothetical protein DYU11_11310 [Fibrisoma montanum]|uniref:Uncharacterized protein n=1 Tax=Fibrisoma montanum TaxID=2305895 RepID=A0A418MB58_9BACT|nr:hypothetical protein [Fibrisoma montanum]RIV23566.1 hypothetical protein DYU11_11310 [Fibrisoma montanum]